MCVYVSVVSSKNDEEDSCHPFPKKSPGKLSRRIMMKRLLCRGSTGAMLSGGCQNWGYAGWFNQQSISNITS